MIGLLLSYRGWIAVWGALSVVVTELREFMADNESRPPPEDDG